MIFRSKILHLNYFAMFTLKGHEPKNTPSNPYSIPKLLKSLGVPSNNFDLFIL